MIKECRLKPGESQTIKAVVGGTGNRKGIKYQWYKLSSPHEDGTPIDGATKDSYVVTFDEEPGFYACKVTDCYGNIFAALVHVAYQNNLTVTADVGDAWAVDTNKHQASITLPADNSDVELKVNIECDDDEDLTVEWYQDDIEDSVGNSDTLILSQVSRNTTYEVVVSDKYGNTEYYYFEISIENGLSLEPVLQDGWTCKDGRVQIKLPEKNDGVTLQVNVIATNSDNLLISWSVDDSYSGKYQLYEYENCTEIRTYPVSERTEYSVVAADCYGNTAELVFELISAQKFEAQNYLMLTVGQSQPVTLFEKSENIVNVAWSVTDENGEPFASDADAFISVNEEGIVTAKAVGTAYAVAEITKVSQSYNQYYGEWEQVYSVSYERCRIDVIPAEGNVEEQPFLSEVTQVSLPVNKATVELYSTNYTLVTVVAETDRISAQSALRDELEVEVPEDTGVAIREAKFTDNTAAGLFELKVVDDRTLAIVPLYSTLELAQAKASNVNGSYKSGIQVIMSDDSVFDVKDAAGNNATLTMTVKKSMPKLKVGKLTFNSVITAYSNYNPDSQILSLTGEKVTMLEPDEVAAAKAKKPTVPDWIEISQSGSDDEVWLATLLENTPAKGSGKLYLLATVEGWAIKQSIVVSYTIKQTYPKISFKPSTITLNSATNDYFFTTGTISPAVFGDAYRFDISISKITEGKGKSLKTYTGDEINKVLQVRINGIYFNEKGKPCLDIGVEPVGNSTIAHTYKVYCSFCGKEFAFTVKTAYKPLTLSMKQNTPLVFVKNDQGQWAYQWGCWFILTLKNQNYVGSAGYHSRITWKDPKTNIEQEVPIKQTYWYYDQETGWEFKEESPESGNPIFTVEDQESAIYVSFTDEQNAYFDNPGGTFYLYTTATTPNGQQSNEAKTKINIKWIKTPKSSTVTASASGSIDVIRPGSTSGINVLLKWSSGGYDNLRNLANQWIYDDGNTIPCAYFVRYYKNGKTWVPEDEIIRIDDEDENNPFNIESYWNKKNQYVNVLTLKDGIAENNDLIDTYKYKLKVFTGKWDKKYQPIFKVINLNIKKGSAKVTATPGTTTLYVKDKFSQATVNLKATDAKLSNIKHVEISETAKTPTPFQLIQIGDEWSTIALGFKNNEIPSGFKAGQTKTVVLKIWFEGNLTSKHDTTVSVKVLIK